MTTAENKLVDWLDLARARLQNAERALAKAQDAYEQVKADVDAIQRTLDFGRTAIEVPSGVDVPLSVIAKQKSHMDALKLIAKNGNGRVKTTDAANAFKAAGRSKAKRRSLYSNLYHLMWDSVEWEREGEGLFRLRGTPDRSASESPFPNGREVAEPKEDGPPSDGAGDEVTIRRTAIPDRVSPRR